MNKELVALFAYIFSFGVPAWIAIFTYDIRWVILTIFNAFTFLFPTVVFIQDVEETE